MASLEASQSESYPLDYSLPPSAKKGRYERVLVPAGSTTPKQSFAGKLKPSNLSQKFRHQQNQQQNQQQQYGPVKANRNFIFGDGLELHSGYYQGMLEIEMQSFNTDKNGVRCDFMNINLTSKEYNVLKDLHSEILEDVSPSFDSGTPESLSYKVSDTLKIDVEFSKGIRRDKEGNENETDYVVKIIRTYPESEPFSVTIQMYPEEFAQMDKCLKGFWFVFSKYPKNMEKSPITRKMLDKLSAEMIRMINDEHPSVTSFGFDELQDPLFANAFFKAYAKLTNFGYIHGIANEMEKEFDKDEYDLFTLLYQCAHQIELLCIAMNTLNKSK
jgi:hypothetical protein